MLIHFHNDLLYVDILFCFYHKHDDLLFNKYVIESIVFLCYDHAIQKYNLMSINLGSFPYTEINDNQFSFPLIPLLFRILKACQLMGNQ